MVIAIDGLAGSGKSTLAVLVAKSLNFHFFNTGLVFRAIAYALDKNGILQSDDNKIKQFLEKSPITVKFDKFKQQVFYENINISKFLKSAKIAKLASTYSQIIFVREYVEQIQKNFAKNNNVVIEGRDIGTKVFPKAKYKFFITASLTERAKRRYISQSEKTHFSIEEIKRQLQDRDYSDINRKISPLIKADDAISIDTTNDTIQQSLNKILSYIR